MSKGPLAPPDAHGHDADDSRQRLIETIAERYLDQLQRGKARSRAEILNEHLEIADVLDRRLTLIEMIHAARGSGPAPRDFDPSEMAQAESDALEPDSGGDPPSPPLDATADLPEFPAPSDPPAPASAADIPDPASPFPDRIGPYRLLEELGQGGMGVVYLADQEEPVRRRVALKLMRPGLDGEDVVGRFEAERQALALMNHPAIARVFEAGRTSRGRPYFAMEHVPGISITEYADRNRLSTIDRLRLFCDACDGVQHAHQKGVIHRDLKPSNILVTADGRATPKIIDFGVAKATNQRLTEQTVYTEYGRVIGTPEYMSPEQAEVTSFDIDTRSDIYSLGVILYELLVGATPFDPTELRRAGFSELRRRIRDEEPPKPSTRLSGMGDTSTEIAQRRRTTPASLSRLLQGDLDWITMKAMEKDRTRRYATASEFRADIERYLAGEPVVARPPSAFYLARKFVGRHRLEVLGGAALAISLLAGLGVSLVLYQEADDQRRRAEAEALVRGELAEVLTEILADLAPQTAGLDDARTVETLQDAQRQLEALVDPDPALLGDAWITLGIAYRSAGQPELAEHGLRRALEVLETPFPGVNEPRLRAGVNLALTLRDLGRARYEEGLRLAEEAYGESAEDLGPTHDLTLLAQNAVADLQKVMRKFGEAEASYRAALDALQEAPAPGVTRQVNIANDLAVLVLRTGRKEDVLEAKQLLDDAWRKLVEVRPPDDHLVLSLRHNLGIAHYHLGELEEAEAHYRYVVPGRKETLGAWHPRTIRSIQNLGAVLYSAGRLTEAAQLGEEAWDAFRRLYGPKHRRTLLAQSNYAMMLLKVDDAATARPLLEEVLEVAPEVYPPGGDDVALFRGNLGKCLAMLGEFERAEKLLLQSLAEHEALGKEGLAGLPDVCEHLEYLYTKWGRPEKAAEYRARIEQLKEGD